MKKFLSIILTALMFIFAITFASCVETVKYGDINGDSEINIADAILIAQYLASWEIDIDMSAADCNCDSKVDIKDAVLMAQYLAKWEVKLGPGTTAPHAVVQAVSYSKKISSEFDNAGLPDTHHTVVLPKVNYNTVAATALNKKIMKKHGDSIEILKTGTEDRTVYKINYSFSVCNDIIGIMISDSRSMVSAYKDQDYFGYYYDTKRDKELSFFEYLEALGVDYAEMVYEINIANNNPYWEYSTDYTNYDISAAIFSDSSFTAELPLPTWGSELKEISVSITESSDKKYDVSKVLMKWYQKNKNKLDTDEYYGGLSSIEFYDLDIDGADEICFIYNDYETIYIFYKLENGIFDMDCSIGPGSGSGYLEDMVLSTGPDGIVSAYFTAIWQLDNVYGYNFVEYRFTNGEWSPNEESRMYLTETLTEPVVYKYNTKSAGAEDYIEISKEKYDEILDWYFDKGYPLV